MLTLFGNNLHYLRLYRILLSSMNIKQKINIFTAGLLFVFSVSLIPLVVNAVTKPPSCGGVTTSIITCTQTNPKGGDITTNGVWGLLLLVLNILTAGVGIVAVGGVVYGSILYTTAGDKAEQVTKSIGVITNVTIGVCTYLVMVGLLRFLNPRGI